MRLHVMTALQFPGARLLVTVSSSISHYYVKIITSRTVRLFSLSSTLFRSCVSQISIMFSFQKIDSLLFFILFWAVFSYSPSFSKRPTPSHDNLLPEMINDPVLLEIKKVSSSYRRCLLDQLFYAKEIWSRLPSAIEACAVGKFWRALDVHSSQVTCWERLHFIPPKPIDSPCVVVRLNIRDGTGDLAREEILRRLMPQCEFFGAGSEDVVNFSSIGKFYKKETSFTEPPDHLWDFGDGRRKSIADDPLYPMMVKEKTFLEKYVKRPRIDYLWIHSGISAWVANKPYAPNTCYHEYSILQDPINVTVCQLAVHHTIFTRIDSDMYSSARPYFKPLFISLLSKSSFLPVRSEYVSIETFGYLSVFFVNVSNPYCVKKYLAHCYGEECQDDD